MWACSMRTICRSPSSHLCLAISIRWCLTSIKSLAIWAHRALSINLASSSRRCHLDRCRQASWASLSARDSLTSLICYNRLSHRVHSDLRLKIRPRLWLHRHLSILMEKSKARRMLSLIKIKLRTVIKININKSKWARNLKISKRRHNQTRSHRAQRRLKETNSQRRKSQRTRA